MNAIPRIRLRVLPQVLPLPNSLSIGTVSEGTAAATITGNPPNQVLNLVVPRGPAGPTLVWRGDWQAGGTEYSVFDAVTVSGSSYACQIAHASGEDFITDLANGFWRLIAEKGDPGPQGIQGIQGEQGPKGDTGDKGDTGAQGPKGDTGDQGPPGANGANGLNGDLVSVADRTALGALATGTGKLANLGEARRAGIFAWSGTNHSADITADPRQAIFFPPSSDATGASGAWVRQFYGPIQASWFHEASDSDDTAGLQAALDYVGARGGSLDIGGTWNASKIVIGGTQRMELTGNLILIGTATTSQTCLIEITRGNFEITGAWLVNCVRKAVYAAGIWSHNDTALQFLDLSKVSVAGAQQAWRIGDSAHPNALISEITLRFGGTYSCPKVLRAEGMETYISILGPEWSADAFDGDAGWQAIAKNVITSIGAYVRVIGGECIQTSDSSATNFLFDVQPIVDGAGELCWGRIETTSVDCETAGPLAILHNPSGLTGTAIVNKGLLSLINCQGFVSQDLADFIQGDASFDGDVFVRDCRFWAPAARTHNNIAFANAAANAWVDDIGFGSNFKAPLAGTSGGIVHFSSRLIIEAQGLPATTYSAPTVLNWQGKTTTGDFPRFNGALSAGVFTVPAGGLKNVRIHAQAYISGITGLLVIRNNGGEVANGPFSSSGSASWEVSSLSSGSTIDVEIVPTTGSGSPNASGFLHRLTITAAA